MFETEIFESILQDLHEIADHHNKLRHMFSSDSYQGDNPSPFSHYHDQKDLYSYTNSLYWTLKECRDDSLAVPWKKLVKIVKNQHPSLAKRSCIRKKLSILRSALLKCLRNKEPLDQYRCSHYKMEFIDNTEKKGRIDNEFV